MRCARFHTYTPGFAIRTCSIRWPSTRAKIMQAKSIYGCKFGQTEYANRAYMLDTSINGKLMKRVASGWKNALSQGRSQGGEGGKFPPPPETEKIAVEKWCYFRKLYF